MVIMALEKNKGNNVRGSGCVWSGGIVVVLEANVSDCYSKLGG